VGSFFEAGAGSKLQCPLDVQWQVCRSLPSLPRSLRGLALECHDAAALNPNEDPAPALIAYLPPYSPELQPAETLWTLVDEPIVNKHFPTIEDIESKVAKQCFAIPEAADNIKT
jgi:transposase